MAFRPSVTWPSGQVAFIAMDTFFVPSNWTPHCLLSTNCISLGSQSLTIGHWPCAFLRAGIFGIKVIVWMLREQVCNRNKVVLGYTCREQKWNEMYFVSILKFWYNNNSSFFFSSRIPKAKNIFKLYIQAGATQVGPYTRYPKNVTLRVLFHISSSSFDFKTNNTHAKISARSMAENQSIPNSAESWNKIDSQVNRESTTNQNGGHVWRK